MGVKLVTGIFMLLVLVFAAACPVTSKRGSQNREVWIESSGEKVHGRPIVPE